MIASRAPRRKRPFYEADSGERIADALILQPGILR
jgi:hypothetical protein